MSYIPAGLGATTDDLSVKYYPGVGWASYQSPAANVCLINIKELLRQLGWGVSTVNGIIDGPTVAGLVWLANRFRSNTGTLPDGGRIDQTAKALGAIAAGGAQMVAERGQVVLGYITKLAKIRGATTWVTPVTPPVTPPVPPPADPALNAGPGVPPPGPGSGLGVLGTPIGIAAIAVGALLLYQATKKSGGRRRRTGRRAR